MRKSKPPMMNLQAPLQFNLPHFGNRKSFKAAEARAREVLRDRGLSEAQIEAELKRTRRQDS